MDDPSQYAFRETERRRPVRVMLTREERAAVEMHARATNLSISAFLRTLGLGYRPKSVYDLDAVAELANVNGDLGRLGGLLKLWLVQRPGVGASVMDVRRVLRGIDELREKLLELMSRA